ncbi:nuclease-related domain-containing protein [Streptomyces sp. HNM0575]|uniref:nuclease-related domain-containing protein n=1 Tax=Streptomyces sp. HNM0575 TaxID=2716338 RepID=UPI003217EDC1
MSLPDDTRVAWLDRKSGQLHVVLQDHRDAVLEVLAPYLTPQGSSAAAPRDPEQTAAQIPDEDLALRKPGHALKQKMVTEGMSRAGYMWRRVRGARSEDDSWRVGWEGERAVGAELQRLSRQGWRVLHSIPLPRHVDIDHLWMGPGGVFCINAKKHKDAKVWVGDDSVMIRGQSYPYVRRSRSEAKRATKALTRACGFTVEVQPLLVFVGIRELDIHSSLSGVRAIRERELAGLGARTGVLEGHQIDSIYEAARWGRTWVDA